MNMKKNHKLCLRQVFPQGGRQREGGAGRVRLHRGQGFRPQIPALPSQVVEIQCFECGSAFVVFLISESHFVLFYLEERQIFKFINHIRFFSINNHVLSL